MSVFKRGRKGYPEFFDTLLPAEPPPDAESKIPDSYWEVVARTHRFLRLAWDAPDIRAREWFIFKAREEYDSSARFRPLFVKRLLSSDPQHRPKKIGTGVKFTDEEVAVRTTPPPNTLFEQVMVYFQKNADRARHCPRHCPNSDCPAPYFLAVKKEVARILQKKCAGSLQREQKRRWWRENRAQNGDVQ